MGNNKNTTKFKITLRFKINIKKNNFTVFFGFKTASFIDSQTDWKTFLFSKTKKNLE
jgi:hypothetical protein